MVCLKRFVSVRVHKENVVLFELFIRFVLFFIWLVLITTKLYLHKVFDVDEVVFHVTVLLSI